MGSLKGCRKLFRGSQLLFVFLELGGIEPVHTTDTNNGCSDHSSCELHRQCRVNAKSRETNADRQATALLYSCVPNHFRVLLANILHDLRMHQQQMDRIIQMRNDIIDATLGRLHDLGHHIVPCLVKIGQGSPNGLVRLR